MARSVTLIGAAPEAGAARLLAAMNAVEGPPVTLHAGGGVALLATAPEQAGRLALLLRDRGSLLKGLHRLQRRLEIGCLAGPFLAFDPAAATCPEEDLPRLLAAAAAPLAAALARDGARHQWDVVLRWTPESALAPRRAELAQHRNRAGMAAAVAAALAALRDARRDALLAALRPVALAVAEAAPVAGDTETGATVLLPAGGEAALETALGAMPAALTEGVSADLKGPLPPLAFAPLRVTELEAASVEQACDALGLPPRFERAELTQRWRDLARRLHPDLAGAAADPGQLEEAGRAYRLLRGLAGTEPEGPLERARLRARAGRHLAVPMAEAV